MLAKVTSASTWGIEGYLIDVEVDISAGLPALNIVGLPDSAIRESRERVRAAIKNSGYDFPAQRITVNLAPADIKKEGSSFDLPIAIGIITASGFIPNEALMRKLFIGELSLDGSINPVKGVLSITLTAKKEGFEAVILPATNIREATLIEGIRIYGIRNLSEAISFLRGEYMPEPAVAGIIQDQELSSEQLDFNEVKGQQFAKRALEIAAAGGHNILMIGPPGAGKTMMAQRFPTILPDMTVDECIETTRIHSVAGTLNPEIPLITRRPFRSPHHTSSDIAIIGGGAFPKPGEVSLAHNGVLFLDEITEFRRNVIEALRQPLEDGRVVVSRAQATVVFPSRFILIGASNPCPCGNLGNPQRACICLPSQIQRYRSKLSGPLLDRIDIQIEIPPVKFADLSEKVSEESSNSIKKRVEVAKKIQNERFKEKGFTSNARMKPKDIKKYCKLPAEALSFLERAMDRLKLSARAYTRILKVARTIADLDGSESITTEHVAEAIQYRKMDRWDMSYSL